MPCIVGVLALQGGVAEHVDHLKMLGSLDEVREVRLPEDMLGLDGLIIPGGESSAIAHLAATAGLIEPLREWVTSGKATWGTCAGLIMIADEVKNQKRGGQLLIGGLHATVYRNYFGSQLGSFKQTLAIPDALAASGVLANSTSDYEAVFIRAPAVEKIADDVQVLARVVQEKTSEYAAGDGTTEVIVAVRQGAILGTSFHPELTADSRWHQYFVSMVKDMQSNK